MPIVAPAVVNKVFAVQLTCAETPILASRVLIIVHSNIILPRLVLKREQLLAPRVQLIVRPSMLARTQYRIVMRAVKSSAN